MNWRGSSGRRGGSFRVERVADMVWAKYTAKKNELKIIVNA